MRLILFPPSCFYVPNFILLDKAAIDQLKPGDAVIVFTPDSAQQKSFLLNELESISLTTHYRFYYRHALPDLTLCTRTRDPRLGDETCDTEADTPHRAHRGGKEE